ncbi:MAG: transketolase [Dehalococcoidales bacterium]|nr:MAG: transketolase [Dehalococcoidales bacterium]
MTDSIISADKIEELKQVSRELKIDALKMIYRRGQGHPGGTFSAAEIITALYFHQLRIRPNDPGWKERDRFILSKGHASAILYAALARLGYFPSSEIEKWGEIGCCLQGHPDMNKTPGVDMSTGCLGHGISVAAGMCLISRLKGLDSRTYVLVGDGECQSGIIWEGVMLAAKYRLANLITILDYNQVQLDGRLDEILPMEPVKDKWASFGWNVIEIDGHAIVQVLDTLQQASNTTDMPTVIIANTIKGKGVSFMEGKAEWHGKVPSEDEMKLAIEELTRNG